MATVQVDFLRNEKPPSSLPKTQRLKFILLGESGVGKTALFKRLVHHSFSTSSESTIGIDFDNIYIRVFIHFDGRRGSGGKGKSPASKATHTQSTAQEQIYCVQIWDTAGHEKFKSVNRQYVRGADGVMIVSSCDAPESFHSSIETFQTLTPFLRPKHEDDSNAEDSNTDSAENSAQFFFVTSKADLLRNSTDSDIIKKIANHKKYAEENSTTCFVTSAKEGTGVEEMFLRMCQTAIESKIYRQMNGNQRRDRSTSVVSSSSSSKSKQSLTPSSKSMSDPLEEPVTTPHPLTTRIRSKAIVSLVGGGSQSTAHRGGGCIC